MTRFRTQWLALVAAMALVALSVSSALGAHPQHADNRGNAVSSFVHELLFGTDEDPEEENLDDEEDELDEEENLDEEEDELDEEENLDEEEDELDEEEEQSEEDGDSNHGQCVREVAKSDEVGENGTHGWAVSFAARVTCWETEGEEGEEEPLGDEEDELTTASEETDAAASAAPGKSGAAHQKAPGKSKVKSAGGNGRGHGRGRR